eukprot:765828-Hanusia_phi.AAC.2
MEDSKLGMFSSFQPQPLSSDLLASRSPLSSSSLIACTSLPCCPHLALPPSSTVDRRRYSNGRPRHSDIAEAEEANALGANFLINTISSKSPAPCPCSCSFTTLSHPSSRHLQGNWTSLPHAVRVSDSEACVVGSPAT